MFHHVKQTACKNCVKTISHICPKGLLCRGASNLMMCVCLSVCLCVCVCVSVTLRRESKKLWNWFWSFTSSKTCQKYCFHDLFQENSDLFTIFFTIFFKSSIFFRNRNLFGEICIFSKKSWSKSCKKRVSADNWSRFLGLVGFSRLTSITLTSKTRIHKLWRVFEIVG